MRKSNFIVLALGLLASIFLLWLWWYLGFAKVDTPADVLVTVAWWLVIGLMWYGISRMEQRRRKQMRTVYISPSALFNCESGLIECTNISQRVDIIEEILKSMRYGFEFQDMPERPEFDCSYIVRTDEYKDAQNWKGSVVRVNRSGESVEKQFDSRASLAAALG